MKLGRLLNPKRVIKSQLRSTFDPAGAVRMGLTGKQAPDSMTAPFKGLLSGGNANPEAPPIDHVPLDGEDGYEDEEGYGSLLDPFDVEDFYQQQDPGYAFELQQGRQELMNSAAAGSGSMSGAALKDLLGYSQNFARTGYNDAFNRHQVQTGNIFSRLSDIARLGQSAAAGVGSAGTQLAGNAGQMISNAGGAEGAGLVGAGNQLGQGATNYWLFRNPQMWGGGG